LREKLRLLAVQGQQMERREKGKKEKRKEKKKKEKRRKENQPQVWQLVEVEI
jgi:hypothetical protein